MRDFKGLGFGVRGLVRVGGGTKCNPCKQIHRELQLIDSIATYANDGPQKFEQAVVAEWQMIGTSNG